MIRTNTEYTDALRRLNDDREFIAAQRMALQQMGLSAEEVKQAMQPAISFHEQLKEEVDTYERMKRGDFRIEDLNGIGRIIIGLRIAADITQAELARRLDVSESVVSRDERNEYQGISVERAQRIIDALRGKLTLTVVQESGSNLESHGSSVAVG